MPPTPHPISLVRKKAGATNQQRLLMTPVGELVPAVLQYSRRAARLLERIALERPALVLSSLVAELSAPNHKGIPKILVDKLADALHAHMDKHPVLPPRIHKSLAPLHERLLTLRKELAHVPVVPRMARLTLEMSPPAMFYAEGRGLDAVPSGLALPLARVRTTPLSWVPVRGAYVDDEMRRYATERALDIIEEPILDEEERLITMLSAERIVRVAHVGGGGVRVTLPDLAMAPELGLEDRDRDHGAPAVFIVLKPERARDLLARIAAREDVVLAWSSAERTRTHKLNSKDLRVRAGAGRDWLGLEGGIAVDEGSAATLGALLDALREGRRYVMLKPGHLGAITDELAEALAPLALAPSAPALLALQSAGATLEGGEALRVLEDANARARSVDGEPPAAFTGSLRPYQKEGLRFLRRVVAWGTGGVLADDMGLGKTRTALALLVERASLGPQLVIAPTSVLHPWQMELRSCAPSLRVTEVRGAAGVRALADAGPGDVLLASYGVLQRSSSSFDKHRFTTLVLDEAQQVKNAAAGRSKAVRALQADARIALTGTPLENHTGELWAVLSSVAPGVFGSWAQFKARFAQPIEKENDLRRRKVLARAIAPFLLRRTKAAVAPELPEKIEVDRVLELMPAERRAYDDLRNALVLDLLRPEDDDREGDGHEKRVKILAALTRLRQCACHPALGADLLTPAEDTEPGTKQRELVDLLLEAKAEGQHALVFSQFVRHLRLARAACDKAGLRTFELTGETAREERARLVDAFQRGADDGGADAFFISLKAGGFGLTLTRATTVVHLDPWWNPAAEDQATDRAHRIGQTLPVTVVRLIAGGTVEEEILSLHAQKRALVDAVLEGTDRAGTLSVDELLSLVRATRRSSRALDEAQEPVET